MKINKDILNISNILILLFIFLSFLIYYPTYFTFYQQDEWQIVGHMTSGGLLSVFNGLSIVEIIFGQQGRIFSNVLNYLLFLLIPYSVTLLATYSIFMHGINTFLIYLLVQKLLKNKFESFIAALFFLTSSIANQAVSWFGTSVSVLTAASLVFISLLYFIKYFETKNNKYAWLSYLALFISLYFKEIGIGIFILYFILYLVFFYKKKVRWNKIIFFIPLIYFLTFFILRVINILFSSDKLVNYANSTTPLKTFLVSNLIVYNLSSISQMIIPVNFALNISKQFLFAMYPFLKINSQADLLFQSIGVDVVSIIFSSIILIFFFLIFSKKVADRNILLIALFIIFFSILPYIILFKNGPYLESRYYYLPLAGVSLLCGLLFSLLRSLRMKIFFYLSLVIFFVFCLVHVQVTMNELYKQTSLAKDRLLILNTVKKNKSSLSKKTIFYITSDTNYIIQNMPLPFQQGLGYTFLVYFYNPNSNLKQLLDNNYLWDMGSEGYKEIGDSGFGYFNNIKLLESTIVKYSLDPNIVYAFYWNSDKQVLINITEQTRNKFVSENSVIIKQ